MCKFMGHLDSDLFLSLHLEVAIIQEVRSKGLEFSPDKAFYVLVLVGIEPVDIRDFGRLMTTPAFAEEGHRPLGMLQVLSIIVEDRPPVSVRDKPQYAPTRLAFDSQPETSVLPLVYLNVAYFLGRAGNPVCYLGHLHLISEFAFSVASGFKSFTIRSILGPQMGGVEKPVTADTCSE
ncbi:hypothetical protein CVT26_012465 [Gymnopilus dilepis]|uniref:DUF8205 domain-containing protein n=1 Tax=Gymnopilus dilepis TaxID=231916 RepID=A0A409YCU0_9AGAR|nr:hypothetical protein CVT26_012465 [Gymnopilus dilepis]